LQILDLIRFDIRKALVLKILDDFPVIAAALHSHIRGSLYHVGFASPATSQ
jgi:hypothetical protein